MEYRKNYKKRSALSRRIIAISLSAAFCVVTFGSGYAQVATASFQPACYLDKTDLLLYAKPLYENNLEKLKGYVPDNLNGILKIILGDAYDEKKDQYVLNTKSYTSRKLVLDRMYEDFEKLKIEVNSYGDDDYSDDDCSDDKDGPCYSSKNDKGRTAEDAVNGYYFTQENIQNWIKDNFLKCFPNLIKEKGENKLDGENIDDKGENKLDGENNEHDYLKTKHEDATKEESKLDLGYDENVSEEEIEKIGEKSKTKTSCSKTVIIFVVVACLFAILVIGLVSYFVTRNSNNGEIKSNEDSSKKNEQSSQGAKPADASQSKNQKKENGTAQIQHAKNSNVGKWVAGIGGGTLLTSFLVAGGIYAKNSANSGILNKIEASEKSESDFAFIGSKDKKIDEIGSENNYNIVEDDEAHAGRAGEKTDAVKNNEEEEVKTKR